MIGTRRRVSWRGRRKLARYLAMRRKVDCGVHFEVTNIRMVLLQQPSVLATWWAPSEACHKIGLANRGLAEVCGACSSSPVPLVIEAASSLLAGEVVNLKACERSSSSSWRMFSRCSSSMLGENLVWAFDGEAREALQEARGAMHEASQNAYHAHGGTMKSMFEKLAYFWTHEGASAAR